jgi:hypothetical protein
LNAQKMEDLFSITINISTAQPLMAICDAKYRFTSVSLGDYGSDNDAAIFSQSDRYI